MAKTKRPPATIQKTPRQTKQVRMAAQVATFSGPLPPPSLLQGYDNIQPGFAERIVRMAENEADHRRHQEQKALDADIKLNHKDFTERRVGQILAFSIVLIMAGIGGYLALHGREITGSVFGDPAIVSIVGAFLNKKEQPKH